MEKSAIEMIELKGTIVFLPFAAGSKSESVRPHLYVSKDEIIKVMKTGDNPFENNSLIAFDGYYVRTRGHYGMGKTFLIEEIEVFHDEEPENEQLEEMEETTEVEDKTVVDDTNEEEK